MSKKVEVTVDFVKQAHEAACKEWKQKIENEFPDLFEKKYKGGTIVYIMRNGIPKYYILTSVLNNAYLTNLETGNIWTDTPMDYTGAYVNEKQLVRYIGSGAEWSISTGEIHVH